MLRQDPNSPKFDRNQLVNTKLDNIHDRENLNELKKQVFIFQTKQKLDYAQPCKKWKKIDTLTN